MDKEKFTSILALLLPEVIHLIAEHYHFDEITAANQFYASKVYSILEQEDSKLWHFSSLTLFRMFIEETQTGTFVIPEEI